MSDGTFLLCITGQIEFVDFILAPAGSSWHCKYELFHGPDWKIIGGLESGLSQVAHIVNNGDKIVFNFPIQIQFKTTNPFGWPQIILSIYKGTQLAGYARTYFPFKPGLHELNITLLRPQASSMLGQIASFFGYQPELLQPKMLASTDGNYNGPAGKMAKKKTFIGTSTYRKGLLHRGFFIIHSPKKIYREVIRMEHTGRIHLSLNVITQGFQVLGYDIGSIKHF